MKSNLNVPRRINGHLYEKKNPYLHRLKEYIRELCLSNIDINNILLPKRGCDFFAPSWVLILSLETEHVYMNSSKTKTYSLGKCLKTVMRIKNPNLQYPRSMSQKFDR